MEEQVTLDSFPVFNQNEMGFLEQVRPIIEKAAESVGAPGSIVKFQSGASKTGDGHTSVFIKNITAFRVKMRRKSSYFSVPRVCVSVIPDGYETKEIKSADDFVRVPLDASRPPDSYADLLSVLVKEAVNRIPKEWDCCSRFEQCSEAMQCVHPDKAFALDCGYRKVINSGKIFFGTNRNID